ncbi:MAG: nitroreductase family protein [Thermoprotei archaeon]
MDVLTAVKTRIESRSFADKKVPESVRRDILEAARMSQSGMNVQHWRFILVESPSGTRKLAELSTTGSWVAGADFAIIVLTDPKYPFHLLDAGRAITSMQLTAWGYGVGSGLYAGYNVESMKKEFAIPGELSIAAVLGFGYPDKEVSGKKSRLPLSQIAFRNMYGTPYQ